MRRLSIAALVVANLLVAILALRHEWGYYELILVFWSEAVVLGLYNVLRMLIVGFAGEAPLGETVSRWVEASTGFRILATFVGTGFFAFKFGTFALCVGLLAATLPAHAAPDGSGGGRVAHAFFAAVPAVGTAVAGLVLSHGWSFIRNFLIGGEYRRMTLLELIFWPYFRMGLVTVVLAGGFVAIGLLPSLADSKAFAVVMILLKIAADCFTHLVEHAWIGSRAVRSAGSIAAQGAPPIVRSA